MSKNFQEILDEIKAEITTSKSGKPVKSFSKSAFDKLAKALVNEPDHTVLVAGTKNGQMQLTEVKPVEKYRQVLRRILQDFGVDKQESARILDASYEIPSVDGMYELASEMIYQYINAGKKFDFLPREDFAGSLSLREVEEATVEYKTIPKYNEDGTVAVESKKFKVTKQKHKVLDKKSKPHRWLKTRFED